MTAELVNDSEFAPGCSQPGSNEVMLERLERVIGKWMHSAFGSFQRLPEPSGLPIVYHSPAVYQFRTAYRIDPLLARVNQPEPRHHVTPTRINGEVTLDDDLRQHWLRRGGLFLVEVGG